MKKRTTSADLLDADVDAASDRHVRASALDPAKLSKFPRKDTWTSANVHFGLLSEALEKSGGRVLKQVGFTRQLNAWLIRHGASWKLVDVERAAYRARQLLQKVLSYRRDGKRAPRRHSQCQILIDKTHISDESCSDSESVVETPCARKDTPLVDLLSDSDNESADLEAKIYPSTPRGARAKSSPTRASPSKGSPPKPAPIKASSLSSWEGLDNLVADASKDDVPLPSDYKRLGKKTKVQHVMRRPSCAAQEPLMDEDPHEAVIVYATDCARVQR